jgi:hypothetical protein
MTFLPTYPYYSNPQSQSQSLNRRVFENITPKTSGERQVVFNSASNETAVYGYRPDVAYFNGSRQSQVYFQQGVKDLYMAGTGQNSLSQVLSEGDTTNLTQAGSQGGKQEAFVAGNIEQSYQTGFNSQNQLTAMGKIDWAIMNGQSGTTNQLNAGEISRLALVGTNNPNATGVQNQVRVDGETRQILSSDYNGRSTGDFYGNVKQWQDDAQGATHVLNFFGGLNQGWLKGQGNQNSIMADEQIIELAIDKDSSANKTRISAQRGIERFGLGGKNNQSEIYSYAGTQATEAVLQGQGNQTLWAGTGQQTVRIGGDNNQSTIVTSAMEGIPPEEFKSEAERKAFEAKQKDTLQLGGNNNKTIAYLGVGDDTIVAHSKAINRNNYSEIEGGAGTDTLLLEGKKEDWTSKEEEDGSMTFTHTRLNQVIKTNNIENITFKQVIDPKKVGNISETNPSNEDANTE